MRLLIKDNNIKLDNINIIYNYKYNFYKVLYKFPYIVINGLPLSINFFKYVKKNGFIYIYINNKDNLALLKKIEIKTRSNIIKFNTYEKYNYIIVKDTNNLFDKLYINSYNINISIIKIKNIHNYYVSIINII